MADLLVTEDEARVYCQLDDDAEPKGDWFEAVIAGVSAQVMAYTGNAYLPKSVAASAKQFPHDGSPTIDIDACREVSGVRVTPTSKDDDSWEDIDEDNWLAEPLNADQKTVLRFVGDVSFPASNIGWGAVALHSLQSGTQWPTEAVSGARVLLVIEVTALWGYETIPDQVKLATCMWVQNLIQRDVAFFSPELAEATARSGPMPSDVKGILDTEQGKRSSVAAV